MKLWLESIFEEQRSFSFLVVKRGSSIEGYCLYTYNNGYIYILQVWLTLMGGLTSKASLSNVIPQVLSYLHENYPNTSFRGVIRANNKEGIEECKALGGHVLNNCNDYPKEIYGNYSPQLYVGVQLD